MEFDQSPFDFLVKLVMVGESGVGKSSLLSRWVHDSFTEDFTTTIGVDFKLKNVPVGNQVARVQVWVSRPAPPAQLRPFLSLGCSRVGWFTKKKGHSRTGALSVRHPLCPNELVGAHTAAATTAANNTNRTITRSYYRGSHGMLFVYDCCKR